MAQVEAQIGSPNTKPRSIGANYSALRKVKAVMGPTFELDAITSNVIIEQKCKIKRLMRVVRFV